MPLMNHIVVALFCLAIIYWLIPGRFRNWCLLLGTIAFLAWKAPISLAILGISTLTSYWIFSIVPTVGWGVSFVLFQNIGYFLFYKSEIAAIYSLTPIDRAIPLGLSYYAFRQIHYALEYYKGKLPSHTFLDYCCYLFFLPTILLGPIHRFPAFLRYHRRKRWDDALLSEGLERILYGYAKVLIIGNFILGVHLDKIATQIASSNIWLGTYLQVLEYTLSAYFIFAGFSDIAIGLALLFGYRVMENFNYPYLAPNINEFWNRWHISLSSWVKDYVFFPIASVSRLPIVGILATMLVIGLWHEISWRYIIWGGIHGLGVATWHLYKDTRLAKYGQNSTIYEWLCIFITFHFVAFTFIFIREDSWDAVFTVLKTLFLID
jgi:alginate O-acetyltransferase complex protein AlgI